MKKEKVTEKEEEIKRLKKKFLVTEKDYITPATKDYKDTKGWKAYEAIQKLPMFVNKISEGSDGRKINIAWATGQFKKKIQGLPDAEVEALLKRKALYSKLFMKGMQSKRLAYLEVNKTKEQGGRKSVLDIKRAEIIELFGRMFKTKEVHRVVTEEWGIEVALGTLETYRKKHINIINQKIEEFKQDYSDIRLSIKKSRLEELVWMYYKRKRLYESTNNREDHKLLLQTLEQVRKESEGEMIRINGKIEFEQEQTIQNHLMVEAFKFLSLKQLVLARIAAKFHRNPLILQKSIAESYYSKYLQSPLPENFPGYPTSETYDFETMVKAAQDREEKENKEEVKVTIIPDENKVLTIKEQLIKRLQTLTKEVNKVKNDTLFSEEIATYE